LVESKQKDSKQFHTPLTIILSTLLASRRSRCSGCQNPVSLCPPQLEATLLGF
jgi:hypothetical protein